MIFFKNVKADLRALKETYKLSFTAAFCTNRGFHALLFYRMANGFYKNKIPLIPLILTRLIQVLYAIDLDYRSGIDGGVMIVHGVGLVVGMGAIVHPGVILYHGVTLGRRKIGYEIPVGDGFPEVGENCVLGAGAKLLGKIKVGANSVIGANVVLTRSVAANSLVKLNNITIIENESSDRT